MAWHPGGHVSVIAVHAHAPMEIGVASRGAMVLSMGTLSAVESVVGSTAACAGPAVDGDELERAVRQL